MKIIGGYLNASMVVKDSRIDYGEVFEGSDAPRFNSGLTQGSNFLSVCLRAFTDSLMF